MLRGTNPRSEMRGSTTTHAVRKVVVAVAKANAVAVNRKGKTGTGEEDERDREDENFVQGRAYWYVGRVDGRDNLFWVQNGVVVAYLAHSLVCVRTCFHLRHGSV